MLHPATGLVRLAVALVASGLLARATPSAAAAQPPEGRAIRLVPIGLPADQLETALDTWRRGCAGIAGGQLPDFVLSGPGVPVVVRRWPDSSSPNGRCGETRRTLANGRLISARIDIFARQSNRRFCFPLSDEIAHEIGHVLGLDDSLTLESIMGPRRPGHLRSVSREECAAAVDLNGAGDTAPAVGEPTPASLPGVPLAELGELRLRWRASSS